MKAEKISEILKQTEVFAPLPKELLTQLGEHSYPMASDTGEIIIRKGDDGDCLYLITSGKVKVHDDNQVVAECGVGEIVGELALLDRGPRSMNVTTIEPTTFLLINRETFFHLLKDRPDVTEKMIGLLTQRLRSQNLRLVDHLKQREDELSRLVKERTQDLHERNLVLKDTLDKLKSTQQQLIMSEKMASLVQLTAGIAHEIQNPLNFVINFSALAQDLLKELKDAPPGEDRDNLMSELEMNIQKIKQHGFRADATIKSMLLHSRTGSGEKQLADVSEQVAEILKLSYQGYRASHGGFQCKVNFHRDESLPKVSIIPQDFSRVLLNLFNNAFYSLHHKQLAYERAARRGYEPELEVTTDFQKGAVSIHVRDNGEGIPVDIRERIFNPFFTTKPPGEGTGLGLSLSYDIITKSHGGKLTVSSEEGKGTRFTITLPV